MSVIDGEGIGTIFTLGGDGCDQRRLTAFFPLPIVHSFDDQKTRPRNDDTRRSIRSWPFSPSLEVAEAGCDELDPSGVVSKIRLDGREEEENDVYEDHDNS